MVEDPFFAVKFDGTPADTFKWFAFVLGGPWIFLAGVVFTAAGINYGVDFVIGLF